MTIDFDELAGKLYDALIAEEGWSGSAVQVPLIAQALKDVAWEAQQICAKECREQAVGHLKQKSNVAAQAADLCNRAILNIELDPNAK